MTNILEGRMTTRPDKQKLANFIRGISRNGMPFVTEQAARHMGIPTRDLGQLLRELSKASILRFEFRYARKGGSRVYKITAPRDMETPWPDVQCREPEPVSEQDDLLARRIERETEIEAHRRHWLEQERAPRMRPVLDHMDRETSRALQGIG